MNEILTQEQRRALQTQLENEYKSLRASVREELLAADENNYGELAEKVHDPGEASVADLLVDLNIAEIDRHVREIQQIEGALRRLADGSYGVCLECGEAIAVPRLQASPAVARCYDCQARFERERSGIASPKL